MIFINTMIYVWWPSVRTTLHWELGCACKLVFLENEITRLTLTLSVSFSPQCESSLDGQRGKCWCVSSWNGKKIPGSSDLPADAECPEELNHWSVSHIHTHTCWGIWSAQPLISLSHTSILYHWFLSLYIFLNILVFIYC